MTTDALAALVGGALREALWRAEDELATPGTDLDLAVAVATTSWATALDRVVLPALADAARDGYAALAPVALPSDPLDAFLAAVRARLVGVPARALQSVREAVDAAATDARSLLAAAVAALDTLGEQDWRPERIARTEWAAARGFAAFQVALDHDAVKTWAAHDDERTRDSHAALDGVTVAAAATFANGCRFPGDPLAVPAETVNCRCVLTVDLSLTAGGSVSEPTLASTTPGAEPQYAGLPPAWRGCLAPLDVLTDDGRIIAKVGDAPRVRPLPVGMQWKQVSGGSGHSGAVVAARLDRAFYAEHDGRACLHGEGVFDLGHDDGKDLARRVADGFAGGVSVDLVDTSWEYRFQLPDGSLAPEPTSWEEWLALMEAGAKEIAVAADWKLATATFCAIPAFEHARIDPVWDYTPPSEATVVAAAALVAATAGEYVYAAADFAVPEPDGPAALTITDDGRVYGHLAVWNTCHTGFPDRCVTPPKSKSDYAYFHVGAVATDTGELAVGKLTVGGGHADTRLGYAPAVEHYDNACTAVAVVRARDGVHGIWVSGHLLPDASPRDVAALRRSPLSGDWRRVRGRLEMMAALAVNTPGFPVPRTLAASAGREPLSLVAAGITPALVPAPTPSTRLTPEAFAVAVLREMKRQTAAEAKADALARRLGLDFDSRAERARARLSS